MAHHSDTKSADAAPPRGTPGLPNQALDDEDPLRAEKIAALEITGGAL